MTLESRLKKLESRDLLVDKSVDAIIIGGAFRRQGGKIARHPGFAMICGEGRPFISAKGGETMQEFERRIDAIMNKACVS